MGNAGGVIGPALVGFIADRAGLRYGMGAIALIPLVLLAIFIWRDLADRPPHALTFSHQAFAHSPSTRIP